MDSRVTAPRPQHTGDTPARAAFRLAVVVAAATTLAVVALLGVAGATAEQHPDSAVPRTRFVDQQPAPLNPTGARTSHNWAGYVARDGSFTGVSGTWSVPPVSAASYGSDATWVGIGGVTTHDLIQAGTGATVRADGTVRYSAWIECLPQISWGIPVTVTPGDSVTTSISLQATDSWRVVLNDNTTNQRYSTLLTYHSSQSSADWVEEAPSNGHSQIPLDRFGVVNFSRAGAMANGQQDTIAAAGGASITMIDRASQAIALPSALGADGASFSVTRNSPLLPAAPSTAFAPHPTSRTNGWGINPGSRHPLPPWKIIIPVSLVG